VDALAMLVCTLAHMTGIREDHNAIQLLQDAGFAAVLVRCHPAESQEKSNESPVVSITVCREGRDDPEQAMTANASIDKVARDGRIGGHCGPAGPTSKRKLRKGRRPGRC
jgi:hypothetical protein